MMMKKLPAIGAALVLGLSCLGSIAARADVIYTYTGNDFTSAISPYTTSDSITGYFVVATPLAANLSLGPITPISFSFSDGVDTLTNANTTSQTFYVATSPSGSLSNWGIAVATAASTEGIEICNSAICTPSQFDNGWTDNEASSAVNRSDPGSWQSSVPEPPSMATLITGLLGLVLLFRRGRTCR